MRMLINSRTLSPVFVDDEPDRGPYADCDWEPFCLTHGDMCERDLADCKVPDSEHPRCDGTWPAPSKTPGSCWHCDGDRNICPCP